MADLLLLTSHSSATEVLPALDLLTARVRTMPLTPSSLMASDACDALVLDARRDLATARSMCRMVTTAGLAVPVLLVVTEGGLTVVAADWGFDDVVLEDAGPAEVATRLRLLTERERGRATLAQAVPEGSRIEVGELAIDPAGYTVRLRGRTLDLTYKEFELLKYLALHPGHVFTRAQLLQEVWGYDYYGGTRTVDVHVRRLRAKLGTEHEALIGTVRNVGYLFEAPEEERARQT